jgi:hypothetical protein
VLSSCPLIQYVPHTDLLATKEQSKNLNIRLPYGTVFTMTIISCGNTEEYLAHVITVLHLINQKGLNILCRKLERLLEKQVGTLENLHKSIGPEGLNFKEVQEACKVKIKQTTKMLEEATKEHSEAMAKTYELLKNGDSQIQWYWICHKMHKRDLWARVNVQVIIGKHPHSWTAFKDCLELLSSQSSLLTWPKGNAITYSRWCASPRGPLCISTWLAWKC